MKAAATKTKNAIMIDDKNEWEGKKINRNSREK